MQPKRFLETQATLVIWLTLALSVPTDGIASPVGTAFTYQGKLDESGIPVTGTVDLELRLFDDPIGGLQTGPTVQLEDVIVQDGLFSVELDLGSVFTNDVALWLELGVRGGAETGAYTLLSPRPKVSPTPLALHATTADLLDGLDADQLVRADGDSMTGSLEMQDSRIELLEGSHRGGELYADVEGLTLTTPGNDRVRIDSELHVTERVGIGLADPGQMLHVNGALRIGDTVNNSSGSIRFNGTDFEGHDGTGWRSFTSGAEGFVDLTSAQTIGGTKTFTRRIAADGGLLAREEIIVGTASQGSHIDLYTSSGALNLFRVGGSKFGELRTNTENDFVLQANNGQLRTQGDLYLQFSSSSSFRDLYADDVIAHDTLQIRDGNGVLQGQFLGSGDDVQFLDGPNDGHLIIRDRLHVSGDSTDRYLTFGAGTAENITFEEGNFSVRDLDLRLGASSDGLLRVFGNAYVSRALDVDGTLDVDDDIELGRNLIFSNLPTGANDGQVCFDDTVIGDIVIRCSSSRRYKQSIARFAPGLAVVQRLRPVSFEWKRSGRPDVGFVAEEVAQLDPLLATYHEGRVDGVKYDRLTTVLVNAIQEQQAQIDALRALVCERRHDAEACGGTRAAPETAAPWELTR